MSWEGGWGGGVSVLIALLKTQELTPTQPQEKTLHASANNGLSSIFYNQDGKGKQNWVRIRAINLKITLNFQTIHFFYKNLFFYKIMLRREKAKNRILFLVLYKIMMMTCFSANVRQCNITYAIVMLHV